MKGVATEMTQAKQEAYDMVVHILENELAEVQRKVRRNKWEMQKLVAEQTKLKRSRGIITNQIRTVKGEKGKES